MTWYAIQAMNSVRDWDSYQNLMHTLNIYRKLRITFTNEKLW